jgi:predicted metalloprotease with PDZ domain
MHKPDQVARDCGRAINLLVQCLFSTSAIQANRPSVLIDEWNSNLNRSQHMLLRGISLLFVFTAATAFGQAVPIRIAADLTDSPRKLYHAEIDIPVKAGPIALITPQWIPGHHTPVGPVADIVGVVFTAGGHALEWTRDDLDLYEFHLTIPSGISSLHVHLDCIVTKRNTANVAVLHWEKLLLYPAGVSVNTIPIQASVKFPVGWGMGTALTPISSSNPGDPAGYTIQYEPTTVDKLQDSPVFAGQYFHEYLLAPEITPKHFLDVFASTQSETNVRQKVIDDMSHLIREAGALYGSRHYDSYHFLLTLTSNGGGGTEHSESSDNGAAENYLSDDVLLSLGGDLLPHEFTHSWNEKYRRPDGEATPDFATPMKLELLWVDEGLTAYLGKMLAARIGFTTPEDYRQALALEAAKMDYEPGRTWRPTEDTAVFFPAFRLTSIWSSSGPAWSTWRRSWDYYQEGDLLWLDVDTTIRKLTEGRKSLRDFLIIFLGKGGNTGPTVLPYNFDEMVSDLNKVVEMDWAKFLKDRVYKINVHADMAGIEQGGYRLVYSDEPSTYERNLLSRNGGGTDVWFSIGLSVDRDGIISDVRLGGPADKAKLAPGEKIIAVDGRTFSMGALHDAILQGKTSTSPMQFVVQNDTFINVADIDYHDGERYPTLVRVPGTQDYLDEVITSITPSGGDVGITH